MSAHLASLRRALTSLHWQSGHDYFYALSEILENAKEVICIADWFVPYNPIHHPPPFFL
jgi:hypothetical protein